MSEHLSLHMQTLEWRQKVAQMHALTKQQEMLRTDSAYCKYSPWVVTGKRLESTFKDKGRSVTLEQS